MNQYRLKVFRFRKRLPDAQVVLSWFVVLVSYSFLIYKLAKYDNYESILQYFAHSEKQNYLFLLIVFLLMPLNIFTEVLKWKTLTQNIQQLSFKTALQSVLAGMTSGFITPNRLGEMLGRIKFLKLENKKAGVTLSIINGLTLNIVIAICGIPAGMLLIATQQAESIHDIRILLSSVLVGASLIMLIYFTLPLYSGKLARIRFGWKLNEFTDCLEIYSLKELIEIVMISFARFFVFSCQLYFMLRFFGVELAVWQAFLAIPATYLFVTFTPSVAFSEAAVRASFSVLIIGLFSTQVASIAFASIVLWLINSVVPMVIGSAFWLRKTHTSTSPNSDI